MKRRDNYVSLTKMNEENSAEDLATALNNYRRPGISRPSLSRSLNRVRPTEPIESVEPNKPVEKPVEPVNEPVSPQEAILDFLRFIEGVKTNLKEIHWNTTSRKTHKLSEDLLDKFSEIQDDIAEDMQGFYGVCIEVGDLVPVESHVGPLSELIKNVLSETITLKASILEVDGLDGIVSILDSMMHDANVGSYLESMEC